MGKGLSDLELKDEPLPVQNLDDLPEFGVWQAPPQPGPYRFQLPDLDKVWDVYDVEGKGQRVRMLLDRDHPLTIVAPAAKAGETFHTRISNQERKRGKDATIEASDMDYLLRAFGVKVRPTNNRAYVEAVSVHSQQQFGADISFSWNCSDKRNIRVYNDKQELTELDQKGCGKAFYQKDVQKVKNEKGELEYPLEVQCSGCGAILRAFANLDNIRA